MHWLMKSEYGYVEVQVRDLYKHFFTQTQKLFQI